MKVVWLGVRFALLLLLLGGLAACGGGGGGAEQSAPIEVQINGVASTGEPVRHAKVEVKTRTGGKFETLTGDDGAFSLVVDQTGTQIIRVSLPGGSAEFLYGLAYAEDSGSISVNIHPLSDLLLRHWFAARNVALETGFNAQTPYSLLPTPGTMATAQQVFTDLLSLALADYQIPDNFDVLSSAFSNNQQGFDRFLENLAIEISGNVFSISITDHKTQITNVITREAALDNIFSLSETNVPGEAANVSVLPTISSIIVSWEAATDDLGVAGYNVYRDDVWQAAVPYLSYVDTNVTRGVAYCYSVEARDGAGNVSARIAAATCPMLLPGLDVTPPAPPGQLQVTETSLHTISLAWQAPVDDDLHSFNIYRSLNGGDFAWLGSVARGDTTFQDSGLSGGVEYCYHVVALDGSENVSEAGNTVCSGVIINNVPSANAGEDQANVPLGLAVQLNGGLSLDPDGDELSYQWRLVSQPQGSTAQLSDNTIVDPTFIPDFHGQYVFELRVSDVHQLASVPDSVTISTEANVAPVAFPGYPRTVVLGDTVILNGSGSYDANGDDLSYHWTLVSAPPGSSATLINANTQNPSFVADAIGSYEVSLVVNDALLDSEPVSNVISVLNLGLEAEPNDEPLLAQLIPQIGRDSPVSAGINPPWDEDWFKFSAEAGVVYTIELYDVNADFGSVSGTGSTACDPGREYPGLAIEVFAQSATALATQCEPVGAGNVHNLLSFTANSSGEHRVRISKNAIGSTQIGNYSLRIVPDYANGGAWDANEEPNNTGYNAYELLVGQAITSNIEPRATSYATNAADRDWYRFSASQGVTYTVELFDVGAALDADSGAGFCDPGASFGGLSVDVFSSADATNRIQAQCQPQGSGNVHNLLVFSANNSSSYFIRVALNPGTGAGNYSIRVVADYANGGVWDNDEEPNNTPFNALQLIPGSAIESKVQTRNSLNATNRTDIDWYRFEALQDVDYTIELFNVANNFNGLSGAGLCDSVIEVSGLAIEVFNDIAAPVPIAGRCEPDGSGNVHNMLVFTPNSSGTFFIRVSFNVATSERGGGYSIRVLPDYRNGALWDSAHEPNNTPYTAHELTVGTAIDTNIEQRNVSFATSVADIDWYRFDASDGVRYTIELFNAGAGLDDASGSGPGACDSVASLSGLALEVFDSLGANTPLAKQCKPTGSGNVHNLLSFTANGGGSYYVRVSLNAITSSQTGAYSIRVIPDFDSGAAWDDNEEPNNTHWNAFAINTGAGNFVSSNIEPKVPSFSTNLADSDWYQFNAQAATTYTIQLLDLGLVLTATGTSDQSCDPLTSLGGLALEVFDETGSNRIALSCDPSGNVAPVHNSLSFTSTGAGTYFVRVSLNPMLSNDGGIYSIEILP